eukprot:scaffold5356_cov335-Prasinococcus_capsulatus_cf.AAC.1
MSKVRYARAWPMWHESYTVGPQMYHRTSRPSRGTKRSFRDVSELCMRSAAAAVAAASGSPSVALPPSGGYHAGCPFTRTAPPKAQPMQRGPVASFAMAMGATKLSEEEEEEEEVVEEHGECDDDTADAGTVEPARESSLLPSLRGDDREPALTPA